MSYRRLRILFICFTDSPHSQAWLDLLKNSEFEVRVFASPVDYGAMYPPQPWRFPTYSVVRPEPRKIMSRAIWLLPRRTRRSSFVNRVRHKFLLDTRWLRWIITRWKPDIVHTLRLNPEATLTWQALRSIPESRRPKWVVSSWGSDLYFEADDPAIQPQIQHILRHCDGFIPDCRRDLRLAMTAGLAASKMALAEPVPTTGGLSLGNFKVLHVPLEKRKLIVIPKAYEGAYNKTLPILEALLLAEDELNGYEIHLLMCSREVQMWLRRMPESFRTQCHCHDMLPSHELLAMLGRTRIMIATSLSDGTPNVMLEAMAAGALPLMSPLDSIQEWIKDGYNGLLAPALHPDRIASALHRALADDDLCRQAQQINWEIVRQRADRELIGQELIGYYQTLLKN